MKNKKSKITILYDGACPFCKATVYHIYLPCTIELIDARNQYHNVLNKIEHRIDNGLIVMHGAHTYQGKEALEHLIRKGTPKSLFTRSLFRLCKNKQRIAFFYPIFRTIRNLWLILCRLPKIDVQS